MFVCSFQFTICTFIPADRTSIKNSCITHFTLNPGEYPKISVPIAMQKHSLNAMKPWMLQNT